MAIDIYWLVVSLLDPRHIALGILFGFLAKSDFQFNVPILVVEVLRMIHIIHFAILVFTFVD